MEQTIRRANKKDTKALKELMFLAYEPIRT